MEFCNEFIYKVHNYIKMNNLLSYGDEIVIGVSGGADSMCLLVVLNSLAVSYNMKINVVHINHGIRGKEADADEAYVKEYCENHSDLNFYSFFYDIKECARQKRLSEEEMGRILRYESFEKVCKETGSKKIAVAHNLNDNVETVLFNICRGTGINGLKGISRMNGKIIRPLMCVTRKEIEKFMHEIGQGYRHDSTNSTTDYTRNRIRLEALPYLEEHINSNVYEHINTLSRIAEETEDFMKDYTDKAYCLIVDRLELDCGYIYEIDVSLLIKERHVIAQRIIRQVICDLVGKLKDISNIHIDNIYDLSDKNVGKHILLPYGIYAQRTYDKIRLSIGKEKTKSCEIYEEVILDKEYYLEYYKKNIIFSVFDHKKEDKIPRNNYTKWFDYDKINDIIVLRNRSVGDKMKLNPKGTTKKLKDLMIDLKINKNERDSIPLVAHGNDVLWLIGERNSEAYRVDDNTSKILEIKMY